MTLGEEEDDDEGELRERSMGGASPNNWEEDMAGLPVFVGIDPAQAVVESQQETVDGRSVTWGPAVLQSLNDRPQRSLTRWIGSPYPFRLVTIPEGSVSSISTAIINMPPNEEAAAVERPPPTH
jgi:hypothetical protein